MDRLKTKRRVRRSQNTKIITDITTALQSATLDINYLKNLRDRLIASNEELRKVNEEIEPMITDADLEADYVAVADYEDQVARALSEVRNKIERQPAAPAIYHVGDDGDRVIPQATGVKLPKLQLLQYQGELTLWQPFWEQFQTAFHRNTRLTEGDKFQYLRSLLSGPAASAISGLQATAECYKDAIKILSERFGNKQRIQREYLERLRSLPTVKSDRDVQGLRNIYDHVQTNIRGLRALGVSSATYSTMMVDVLLSNLPTDIVVEYHRLKRYGIGLGVPVNGRERAGTTHDGQPLDDVSPSPTDADEELDKLLRFMRVEIESREQSSPLERRPTTVPTVAQIQRPGANPPSTLVLHTSGTDNTCFFCNYRTHRTGDCPSDITLDEKKKMLAQDMRCFRCTKRGHRSRDCRSQQRCTGCRGRHVTSMCNPAWVALSTVQETANVLTAGSTMTVQTPSVLLQTFRSWVGTGLNRAYIRGIIDGGSQKTFIREDLARKLNLKVVGERIMQLNTFACSDSNRCRQKFTVVRIQIRGQYKTTDHVLEAVVVPFICQNIIETPVEHTFLKTIPGDIADKLMFPSTQVEAGISLLIGADQMWKLLTGETRRSSCNTGLVAIATTLGWTFQGPTSTVSVLSNNTTNLMVCVLNVGGADEEDDEVLKHFWELESIGIVDEPMDKKQQEEKVFEQFKENIRQKNGRYEVALPWKETKTTLGDNYMIANTRLRSLVRRLTQDGSIAQYDKAIRSYFKDGHAEEIELNASTYRHVYYMPHRAVIRVNSESTRLRVVFDASSHATNTGSLNDHLEKGPTINTELLPVLLRFRMQKVAITADIQKAFLQIVISERDRDALRFLWFENTPKPNEPLPNTKEWRMTRVPFGTTSSPFLLGATIQHHLQNVSGPNNDIAAILLRSFYVDDLLTGAANIKEAQRLADGALTLLREAGMELQKWNTNSSQLQKLFDQRADNVDHSSENKPFKSPEVTKILGLVWDKNADDFKFSADHLLEILSTNLNTKRSVLKASARIFDPLGFLSPYVIRAKILFQRIWQCGLGWDEVLTEALLQEWKSWCADLTELPQITTPRYLLGVEGESELEIHIFTDASPLAYGTCAYLRAVNRKGEVSVNLIFAKARVAPLKTLTLPRLELMGALLGARIATYIRSSLLGHTVTIWYWTDSTITLGWIKGLATEWQPFVCNRVAEIQALSDPSSWHHCPGYENPADALTRGKTVVQLETQQVWWSGPEWLALEQRNWPVSTPLENLEEIDGEKQQRTETLLTVVHEQAALLTIENFSSYTKMLRVTAWVKRFVHNCRQNNGSAELPLTTQEITDAELFWIKHTQKECFDKEIQEIIQTGRIATRSKISDLQPFLDETGIMRIQGRLHQATLTKDVRHPILLSGDHPYTKLLVTATHLRTVHGGLQATLTELRERFWLPGARRIVKKILAQCRTCRRFSAKPATAPVAPLPRDRVEEGHPFQVVGVDFAGPLFASSKGQCAKTYIALFTCATTRAIHLELVSSTTTASFLLALRRFVARRGIPTTIYSDNALTFKRTAKDLKALWEAIRSTGSQDFCSTHRITWKFIVERAAWWGDWWERMVRSVKTCMRKVLGRQSLSFEELTTVLTDIEAAINSRPLTYLHADNSEPTALTPAHLLIGRRLTTLPETEPPRPVASSRDALSRRWQYRQKLMNNFWVRWKKEYLLELRSAHLATPLNSRPPKIGDVALLHDDIAPRHLWTLVRVIDVLSGRDGNVRACTIRLPSGSVTRRPVQLLYPLEAI